MPSSHRRYAEWTPARFRRWAASIGPQTEGLIIAIPASRPHPEQGFRTCLGILRLYRDLRRDRAEAVSGRAVEIGGVLTLSEVADRLREITDRVSIPVIADADDGYGGILHIVRTIHEFERAGIAALHLEDMTVKKHGHPMPLPQMLDHLKAALDARKDPNLAIVARTDAVAPWRSGVKENYAACEQEAFDRSAAYAEAGADMLMPLFASTPWLRKHGPNLTRPIMILPPEVKAAELESANVKVVLYATSMLSRTHRFMKQQYANWLEQDMFDATDIDLADRVEAHNLVGMSEKEELLARYAQQ